MATAFQRRASPWVRSLRWRCEEAENILRGEVLNDATIAAAAAAAAAESRPIDDFRSGGDYRRQMVEVLVARGLKRIAEQG